MCLGYIGNFKYIIMKKIHLAYLVALMLFSRLSVSAQLTNLPDDQLAFEEALVINVDAHVNHSFSQVKNAFHLAYQANPEIPRGMLEAVSFNYTRFTHRSFTKETDDAGIGMPRTYGVMGLTLDGKNYFRNNYSKNKIYNGKFHRS